MAEKTKEHLAVWLAGNVLGLAHDGDCWDHFNETARINKQIFQTVEELEEAIYSPDGFFAVLEALPEHAKVGNMNFSWWRFLHDLDKEAFYNAVYEAMKK